MFAITRRKLFLYVLIHLDGQRLQSPSPQWAEIKKPSTSVGGDYKALYLGGWRLQSPPLQSVEVLC